LFRGKKLLGVFCGLCKRIEYYNKADVGASKTHPFLRLTMHSTIFKTFKHLKFKKRTSLQALNQLGTPGGAKRFLRGAQHFWTGSNSFKLCPTHFSRRGKNFSWGLRPPCAPLVTGLLRCFTPACHRCAM